MTFMFFPQTDQRPEFPSHPHMALSPLSDSCLLDVWLQDMKINKLAMINRVSDFMSKA